MLTEKDVRGLKTICHAILLSGLKDAKEIKHHTELQVFLESDWCEYLCSLVNISYRLYKEKLVERMKKTIEDSKPKRLKTYRLVAVLKGG